MTLPDSFIVNLCALPSPHLPAQLSTTESQHLRLFVSRRKVDGRDRFYLHAGFFPTLAEAEHQLVIFRCRYPNAFVSRLGPRPSASPPIAVLSETETLRVLESRPPRSDDRGDEHSETGFYTVTPEPQLLSSPRQPLPVAMTATSLSSPAPVTRAATERTGRATGSSRDLAEALKDLAAKPDVPEHTDLSSTTGVRHLSMEFVRKSKRRTKPAATARRT